MHVGERRLGVEPAQKAERGVQDRVVTLLLVLGLDRALTNHHRIDSPETDLRSFVGETE